MNQKHNSLSFGLSMRLYVALLAILFMPLVSSAQDVPSVPHIDSFNMNASQPHDNLNAPDIIWYDDFSSIETYYEATGYLDTSGGFGGDEAFLCIYYEGYRGTGDLRQFIGNSPIGGDLVLDRSVDPINEVYVRFYVKHQAGWIGGAPGKLLRVTSMANSSWHQFMINDLRSDDSGNNECLAVEPITLVQGSTVMSTKYDDYAHMTYLGTMPSDYPICSSDETGRWVLVEMQTKLNTLGQSDGIARLWIDGKLEAERTDLNFRGSYTGEGIHGIFIESYANEPAPATQYRWLDNYVVSRTRIGPAICSDNPTLYKTPYIGSGDFSAWELEIAANTKGTDVVYQSNIQNTEDGLIVNIANGTFTGTRAGEIGLNLGQTYYCRARQQGGEPAQWSDWSDWHQVLSIEPDAGDTYSLTVNNGGGSGHYIDTQVITIVADAASPNMIFDQWIGDTTGIEDIYSASTTLIMPASPTEVTANFGIGGYALTVDRGTGSGLYGEDEIITISADAPLSGQVFDAWIGDIDGIADIHAADTTITISSCITAIRATYKPMPRAAVLISCGSLTGDDYQSPGHIMGGVEGTNWNALDQSSGGLLNSLVDSNGIVHPTWSAENGKGGSNGYVQFWNDCSYEPAGGGALGVFSDSSCGTFQWGWQHETGVRVVLDPGTYDVYITAKFTADGNTGGQNYRVYWGTVDSTEQVHGQVYILDYYSELISNGIYEIWIEGESYAVHRVTVPAGEDLMVASVNPDGGIWGRTAFNSVEAVPVSLSYEILAGADTGGTITPSGPVSVNEHTDHLFTIESDLGYQIADVVTTGSVSHGPISEYWFLNVTDDQTIHVTFAPCETYTITVTQTADGTISPDTLDVNESTNKTFIISPDPGYMVEDVITTGAVSHGSTFEYTFTNITEDQTITATFGPTSPPPTGTVIINEFMADNESTLPDEDGDFSDWIELYNPTDQPVSIYGWYLTDDEDDLTKWQLPNVILAPGEYVVVFASGKDRSDPEGELHTNFSLSAEGEYLALVAWDGTTIIDEYSPVYPEQFEDVSYGLRHGTDTLIFMTTATPGENNADGLLGIVGDTRFSINRGFFDAPITVDITTATPGAVIRYTLDCSAPTETTGTIYTTPLTFDHTTTLRAIAYKTDYFSSNVDTQTYIFLDDVVNQNDTQAYSRGFPDVWYEYNSTIAYTPDYEIDDRVFSDPEQFKNDLKAVPTMSLVMDMDDAFDKYQGFYVNARQSGYVWERGCSLEYYDPNTGEEFQVNCGVRAQGNQNRRPENSAKHSMRFLFKKIYGPGKLRFPLFKDSYVTEFDQIILRGGMGDSWTGWSESANTTFTRDNYTHWTLREMGCPAPHSTYVHLYINGLYWGLYNPVERPNNSFHASYLGGEREDWQATNSNRAIDSHANNDYLIIYHAILEYFQDGTINDAQYDEVAELLDMEAFVDYLLINFYGGMGDWGSYNWYGGALGTVESPIYKHHFVTWDGEESMGLWSINPYTNIVDGGFSADANICRIYERIKDNAKFQSLFADRAHKWLFNNSVLTPDSVMDRWQSVNAIIDRAIVGEAARWGDFMDGNKANPKTRDIWLYEVNSVAADFIPVRTDIFIQQLRDENLYPDTDAPSFSQHGGIVSTGFGVIITGTGDATIYYTIDGSDPRDSGIAIASGQAVAINTNLQLKARAQNNSTSEWSALNEATFVLNSVSGLRITEINYNPYDPTPDEIAATYDDSNMFEFIEILNAGADPCDLTGVIFVDGIDFTFSPMILEAGQYVVVVKNQPAFEFRYGMGLNIAGEFENDTSLSNGGEDIILHDISANPIADFEYNDGGAWPGRPDGTGSSLEVIDTEADYNDPDNWRSSSEYGGTPCAAGNGPVTSVVINEVLSHTDLPDIDTIELHNTTGQAIDISDWSLSDSDINLIKFIIPPGTSIPANGYIVFNEDDFNSSGGIDPCDFALSSSGDDVWLLISDGFGNPVTFVDHVEIDATETGVSLGRWLDGEGRMFPMTTTTFGPTGIEGAPNSGPRVGFVVISELHYNPTPPPLGYTISQDNLEFIELHNTTDVPISLTNWKITNGVDITFPEGTSIDPDERIVIVRFDPTDVVSVSDFRDIYNISASILLIGEYSGRLSNEGETINLKRPDEPPQGETDIPYILVDRVDYEVDTPWPPQPNGEGDSLTRVSDEAFGSFAASWEAATPTPGTIGEETPELAGDFNADGTVDQADYTIWADSYGQTGTALPADANNDGVVDQADYTIWADNYGQTSEELPGDANDDGTVDQADYTIWADNYGRTGADLPGDFNNDGIVDQADYTIWADNYGETN